MVARSRGVKFELYKTRGYFPLYLSSNVSVDNVEKANEALHDVFRWLGFREVGEYLEALPKLGKKIFKFAKERGDE